MEKCFSDPSLARHHTRLWDLISVLRESHSQGSELMDTHDRGHVGADPGPEGGPRGTST